MTGVTGAFLTRVLRRRTQYLIAFVGMTVLFAAWTGASADYAMTANPQAASAVVAMIFIYYMFYTIMHPLTYVFITEIFPFSHRAKGVGLTQTFSRAGSAFNQFTNPLMLAALNYKAYGIYVAWLAIETVVIFFVYPETKGPTLEELGDRKSALAVSEFHSYGTDGPSSLVFEEEDPLEKGIMRTTTV